MPLQSLTRLIGSFRTQFDIRKHSILLVLMGFPFLCSGQETTRQPLISVIARATPDSVMLRWAIDQPAFWKRANTYGYSIERFTISRKGALLNPPERKMLATNPIKPLPLERWQTAVQTNDYAAILATSPIRRRL